METLPHEILALIGEKLYVKDRCMLYISFKYAWKHCTCDQINHHRKFYKALNDINNIKYTIMENLNFQGNKCESQRIIGENCIIYKQSDKLHIINKNLLIEIIDSKITRYFNAGGFYIKY